MDWKLYERHPLSAAYADITGPAFDAMVANLQEYGILGGRRIALYQGKILDGWQLYRACLIADMEPEFWKPNLQFMDPEQWVATVNDHRRHESQQEIVRRAEARRGRVAQARQEGQSLRTIAEEEGVSKVTIERDLEAIEEATVPGGQSPDEPAFVPPEEVKGKDGRTYKAPPKKKPIFCEFCKKLPKAKKGCKQCKEARKQAKKKVRVLCNKCQRLGAVEGCSICEGLNNPAHTDAKPGSITFDWVEFERDFGVLAQYIPQLTKAYGNLVDRHTEKAVRDSLNEFLLNMRKMQRSLEGRLNNTTARTSK